jgi:hypothetical protein
LLPNGKEEVPSQNPPATHVVERATKREVPHTVKQQTFSSKKKNCLTVGLLEARAGTLTTELLGLASSVVGDEECAVVGDKSLLELVLGVLIDELLVVGDLEMRVSLDPVERVLFWMCRANHVGRAQICFVSSSSSSSCCSAIGSCWILAEIERTMDLAIA